MKVSDCKHPNRHLLYTKEQWTDRHPYGENDYYDYYLKCEICKSKVKVGDNFSIYKHHYEELTGRVLGIETAKKLFKEHPNLYHNINDLDPEYKKIIQNNPQLEKQIASKRKKIAKLKEELKELQMQYNGGVDLTL